MKHDKRKKINRQSFKECETELAKQKIKSERKWVVVAFADILGFAPWIRRASNSPEELKKFVIHLYRKFTYLSTGKGYFVKLLGDGAMIVRELENGHHNCKTVIAMLKDMDCLHKYINNIIERSGFPRPTGSRIRIAAGHVIKLTSQFCDRNCFLQDDYIGYPVNLAARLLDVLPATEPVICHESVKDVVGKKGDKHELIFRQLKIDNERRLDGIDEEDLNSLWSVSFGTRADDKVPDTLIPGGD